MAINVRISFIVVILLRLVIISSFFIISPAKVGIIMDIAKQSTTKIIFAVRGNLLTALLLSKVSFHLKPERLHFDVTGGEALGQNIAFPPHPLLPGRQYPSVSWYCPPGSREQVAR